MPLKSDRAKAITTEVMEDWQKVQENYGYFFTESVVETYFAEAFPVCFVTMVSKVVILH